jgi:hypothetical protein
MTVFIAMPTPLTISSSPACARMTDLLLPYLGSGCDAVTADARAEIPVSQDLRPARPAAAAANLGSVSH